jgi:hypothetical protein
MKTTLKKLIRPVTFRGHKFDARTVQMIKWAEKQAGFTFVISQGSYNGGGVAASAGTHDGGGAADFSVHGLSTIELGEMLRSLKDAGFAAWHRLPSQGFSSEHVHVIAIGCSDLAWVAKQQEKAYIAGRDGLKTNDLDKTYRPKPLVKFNMLLNKPVPLKK